MGKFIDLTGQKFGRLTVIKRTENRGHATMWHCQCDCGNTTNVASYTLRNGTQVSCGCYCREQTSKRNKKDITGQTFGYLTVIKSSNQQDRYNRTIWECQCICGNKAFVPTALLTGGHTKSCGCRQKEIQSELIQNNINRNKGIKAVQNSVFNHIKGSARKRGIEFKLSKEQVLKLTQSNCFYCGVNSSNVIIAGRYHYDKDYVYNGIDRIDSNKGYESNNVVPCCKYCNLAKNIMTQTEFFEWIKRVSKHLQIV